MTLAADLRRTIRGEVRFDDGSRALYATDASNYRQTPIGVVVPRDSEDVVAAIAACRDHGAPVLARGGGTSLAGQCCNTAVVLDFSKYMNRVLEVDPERGLARVQPGVVLDDLQAAAAPHGLAFGPDPATHDRCTLGGMIGNNACGVHSVRAGKTVDNVEELEILTYDGTRMRVGETSEDDLEHIIRTGGRKGEVYARLRELRDRYGDLVRERYPDIPRRVSGFNLDELLPENGFHIARALVGTEGTCATVLEATVRLTHSPPRRSLLVLGYPDAYAAGDHVPEILEHEPLGLEGFDHGLTEAMVRKDLHTADLTLLPEGGGWLLAEFGGETRDEADGRAGELAAALERSGGAPALRLVSDPAEQERVWAVRESALGATAFVPGLDPAWAGWEDAAVAPAHVGDYLRDFRALLDRYGYRGTYYGHFGDGCIHVRVDFDLTSRSGIAAYRRFAGEATELVLRYGGSLSGEHGDGQARAELLPAMFGEELVGAFREFKRAWDPDGKLNPGKVVDPAPLDANLRLGADYQPAEPETHFQFPDDGGSFAHATLRCVGVGKCRKTDAGTMCPSYMVTREEEHSTRGRAHLLHEMLTGETVTGGWRDDDVKDALDLCLSCKGCKDECPVSVDVATYKAEFLSHYWEGRRRPRSAYAFGLIHRWARIGSRVPRLANAFTQTPVLRDVAKLAAGMPRERTIPAFAPETFKRWFFGRESGDEELAPPVLLWPDTFNNHFRPETAKAAVHVLESAGFRVIVPRAPLCCGRPLYDFGMLERARRLLRETIEALGDELRAGVPVVGLEPSCIAVFRDELPNLFPRDEDARRLAEQTHTLAEFLENAAPGYAPPTLERRALVHGHCHHKAVLGMDSDRAVLAALGLDVDVLDSGCCGMAGSFGFEEEKYDVSMAVGERVLLPAVRAAEPDTLIIADGFSCREQIEQATDRDALHLAEVIGMGQSGD